MEQQYTCPECKQDYTRFTIHEHYECGVEPLESTEVVEQENTQFTPEEVESSETEQPPAPKKRGRKPKA